MPIIIIAILVSFLLNIALSIFSIYTDRNAFSLNKVFWIFNLLFLSAIPLVQFFLGTFPWGRIITNSTVLTANGLIIICNIAYILVWQKTNEKLIEHRENPVIFDPKKSATIILFIAACISLIVFSNQGRFWIKSNGVSINNSTLQLLADKGLRGIALFGLIAIIHLWQKQKINNSLFTTLLFLGLVANFPTAIPRYWLATFYLAALLLIFKKRFIRIKHLFATSLIGLSILAFPLLSILRYNVSEIPTRFPTLKSVFSFSFLGGDYDAYSSLCTTIIYVTHNGITWGKQLTTVLLFFVPRSFWSGKSIGSGALVNKLPNSDFNNFSSPFIAEGFINFGVVGAILFISIAAWFISKYDQLYWQCNDNNFKKQFYPAALGLFFFMLRGDLLSSFAYSVGLFFAGWFAYKLAAKHYNFKRK
ncbi:MAG: hypothetical protein IT256_06500 [Chitinophagaceae bacterium]|nr:hypothetical protein [Chitinophagaceae bacterium]